MIASPRIAYLLATATQSLDDRQKNYGRHSSHYYIRHLQTSSPTLVIIQYWEGW